ncbi:nucleotidyltransferase domain-containing protein [Coleofasciculus sp. E2-BRE-01]|uniref:nucleotidyltransferase domain-containing protein n=1 Tax=Coleofasciculus sp. E2-BRE-01 TaxID=3069524 RepID=UPI0032F876E3
MPNQTAITRHQQSIKLPTITQTMLTQSRQKKLPPQVTNILQELKSYLEKVYQQQLEKIILYGSQARGDAEPDSDIDVLIVLK